MVMRCSVRSSSANIDGYCEVLELKCILIGINTYMYIVYINTFEGRLVVEYWSSNLEVQSQSHTGAMDYDKGFSWILLIKWSTTSERMCLYMRFLSGLPYA